MCLKNAITLLLAAGALTLFAACGDDTTDPKDTSTTDTTSDVGGDTTADTTESDTTVVGDFATLVFTIDDSANGTYDAADGLAWKGSFAYDAATNVVALDTTWGGPFPMLFDDGSHGDATAGDHIWTIAMQVATPAADLTFEYGAISGSVDGSDGSWIWNKPSNGSVTVPADETGTVTAEGMVIAAFGVVDLKLTIDVSDDGANLDPLFVGTHTDVKVKGSKWGWTEVAMVDDGTKGDDTASDGIYTFLLSENLGKHDGLLKPEDEAAFVFVLGGVEYKVAGAPVATGVGAYLDSGAGFEPAPIQNYPSGDMNTYVKVGAEAFVPPADHVAVNFTIDDTANTTYDATDGLAWKGSFAYNAATRIMTKDGTWSGPFALLWDDGPWDAGGHEPAGATAGDNIWGITVWVSNAAADSFEYGAIRNSVDGSDGQWIWIGSNGTFDVAAGATTAINAAGLTIPAHGTIDLLLTIDASSNGANLQALFQGVDYTGKVKIKGSAWGWTEIAMVDDGTKGDATAADGSYAFQLSENLAKHDGLLKTGDKPEFVVVLDGVEYKADGAASSVGMTASLGTTGAWTAATISVLDSNKNTYVEVP